jgi:histidyl-tRNA synthetase
MGFAGPDVDAELIIMCARMWQRLGLERISLEINTLGTPETRARYRDELVSYFSAVKSKLDEDSIRRLEKNPLRILDSKNPEMQGLIAAAPVVFDFLDEESASHFAGLKALLDLARVSYTVNPRLVRGLDYYNLTVFEWITDALGSQGAICSGGRYDGLVEKLGGRSMPAIGWAMGIERLVGLYEASGGEPRLEGPHVYIVAVGAAALERGMEMAENLRDVMTGVRVEMNLGGGSFKSQLKRADKSGAEIAVILGEEEVQRGEAGMKPLRSNDEQSSVRMEDLAETLSRQLAGN